MLDGFARLAKLMRIGIGGSRFSLADWRLVSGNAVVWHVGPFPSWFSAKLDWLAQQLVAKVHDVVGQGAPQRDTFGFL